MHIRKWKLEIACVLLCVCFVKYWERTLLLSSVDSMQMDISSRKIALRIALSFVGIIIKWKEQICVF